MIICTNTVSSFSLYFEDTMEKCVKKVFQGGYDMTIYPIAYPVDSLNITEGIQVHEQTHDILTRVRSSQKIKQESPNYAIFSLDIYCVLFSFIITWIILNIVIGFMLCHQRPPFSFRLLCHEAIRSFIDLTSSHFGNVYYHSLHHSLHLSLFLSITLLVTLYNSCFSNESIIIPSIKAYDSYKSLHDDPPTMILMIYEDIDLIDRGRLSRPGQVDYLKRLRPIMMTGTEATKRNGSRATALGSLGDRSCAIFKTWLKIDSAELNALVIKKVDPNAVKVQMQPTFSNSLTKSSSGNNVLKAMRILLEMGFTYDIRDTGYLHKFASKVVQLPLSDIMTANLREIAFSKCGPFKSVPNSQRNVSFDLIKILITVSCYLIVASFVFLIMEFIDFFCLKILAHMQQKKMLRCPERRMRMKRNTGFIYF